MDRLKNPASLCALIVLICAAFIHGAIWPDGHIAIKLLTVLSEIAGGAGSLFFGAGLAKPAPAQP